MESVSSKNTPDFDELRAEYLRIYFEMKRKATPVAKKISQVSTGFFDRLKNLAFDIMAPEEKSWEPPNLDLEKRILALAKSPELSEQSQSWQGILEHMELAEKRVSIFLVEREASITQINGLQSSARHGKSELLRHYEKLAKADKVIREESAKLLEDARKLLELMNFLAPKNHS